jgi:16S rRNA (cytosine967-C5)-methyltransferase
LKPAKNNDRIIALNAIFSVVVLKKSLNEFDFDGNSFATSLSFGVLRFYHHLNSIIQPLLKKDFKKEDLDIFCILLLGSYQLIYEDNPEYAIVNESVNLTNKPWAKGLINAILRKIAKLKISPNNSHRSHPAWLEKKIKNQYPNDFNEIFKQNNTKAPMTIRVSGDLLKYKNQLEKVGIKSKTLDNFNQALVLDNPTPVSKLPDFEFGSCYVQDASPQLCKDILSPQNGELILDSCAAPGGKTTHLASVKGVQIIALDSSENRLKRVAENIKRMRQKNVVIKVGDARNDDWWDGVLFDKILLDAPCSATGVIRRHPDIKILRKATDINKLAKVQAQMLKNLWQMLKPGGVLLYATCSILEIENSLQIENFLKENKNCQLEKIDIDWGVQNIGIQKLPSENFDGFYYAKLRKI